MKKLLFILSFAPAFAWGQVGTGKAKLVVGIVVDQMRSDFLYRFEHLYTPHGFKRLMREGFAARNHQYSYMPTTTAPGHASIYTGTTPSVHGIAGNNWYDPRLGQNVYCVSDAAVRSVGVSRAEGQMSPVHLMTTTITDELELFWNDRSVVIGIAVKDRGAILPAGHLADGAYWLHNGRFITSSWYREQLPEWVQEFNELHLAEHYLAQGWKPLLSEDAYAASLPDSNAYEFVMAGEQAPVLPRDLQALAAANGGLDIIKNTPFGNSISIALAAEAVKAEGMGRDTITDFLCLSLSSTDYIGHAYGPRSVEAQDAYLRLDRELAGFLDFLDATVGAGQYTLFLTADHGAADVPAFAIDQHLPGNYLDADTMRRALTAAFADVEGGFDALVEAVEGNELYFDRAALLREGLSVEQASQRVIAVLSRMPGIYAAYAAADISSRAPQDFPLLQLYRGLYPPLAGDVIWVPSSGWIEYGRVGTTHGSPWMYDRHVPLLLFGKGIRRSYTLAETHIRDIAPTLSMLLSVPLPSGCTGRPIAEALDSLR